MAASPSSRASWVIARGTLADRANFSGSDAAHAATTERSGGREKVPSSSTASKTRA